MIVAGCSDMGDAVKVTGPPGGGAVSYQNDVQPIFVTRGCLGCHGSSSPDYTGILFSHGTFVSQASFGYSPVLIVKPFDPAASVLFNKIENTGLYGPLMPQGALTKIPQSERDLIRTWILEGAQDN